MPNKHVLPRIQKLFPLCTISLLATSPSLPVPRGVSGGAAALSSLCRRPFLRRHNESHFAAEPPERAFLRRFRVSGFCLRSFARAKNGVNLRRRSRKISVGKAKSDSKPPPPRGSQIWRDFPREEQGTTNEKMCDTIILPTGKAPCGDAYGHCPTAPLTPLQNMYPDAWGRNSHSPTSRSQGRRYRKD